MLGPVTAGTRHRVGVQQQAGAQQQAAVTHVDVLVVGAGLSGIGAACHLARELPRTSYLVLEARDAVGGTWDLFRYPGVRSDSDMATFGYGFHPWRGTQSLADGPSILRYLQDTAREHGVLEHVRLGHRVVSAAWSSQDTRWTVHVERADGERLETTCRFLFCNTGYYRYDHGHTPDIPGLDDFAGPVVHPQQWPADLDWSGRRVVVVGSGATAVTLVPELARTAAHVTMLQRTPTYVFSVPPTDALAERLSRRLPPPVASSVVRVKNALRGEVVYRLTRVAPGVVRSVLRRDAARHLPPGYDVAADFEPDYDPWDQRLCAAPDGDLFAAVREGSAEVVTGTIERVLPHGIRLHDGREVPADIVVTATGLDLLAFGGIALSVDGTPVDPAGCLTYRGMMLSEVPNLAFTIGYTTASWTLRADLVATHVCRMLQHLGRRGHTVVTPVLPAGASAWQRDPLIGFSSGYVLRGRALMPQQGPRAPWRLHQSYLRDLVTLRLGRVATSALRFE
jgi:monooxygenase